MRLATLMLLAGREELPEALVSELRSYHARVDALFLEAVDGYRGDGHDMLPTYITEMLVGELSQEMTTTTCGNAPSEIRRVLGPA